MILPTKPKGWIYHRSKTGTKFRLDDLLGDNDNSRKQLRKARISKLNLTLRCLAVWKINLILFYYKFIVCSEIHHSSQSVQRDTGLLSQRLASRQGLTAVNLAFALQDLLHLEGTRFEESNYPLPGLTLHLLPGLIYRAEMAT